MARRATAVQAVDQVKDLVKVLKVAEQVLPGYLERARLELLELTGRLPTSERGADYSGDPPPYYQDPTGEKVIHFRAVRDGNCDPTEDLDRYQAFSEDVRRLVGSTRRLLNNAPAATLAVVDGRKPTDGRSAEEHAQRKFVRVLSGEQCVVGVDHVEDDRFGPGQLRRGLCDRHRKAFSRWEEANSASLFGVERSARLARWQSETYGAVPAVEEPQVDSPYKSLKKVA